MLGSKVLHIAFILPCSLRTQSAHNVEITPEHLCRWLLQIVVKLAKADGSQWPSLERSDRVAAPNWSSPMEKPAAPWVTKKPINWSQLESEVKKEEKEEQPEGDAAVMKLFRQIYQDADEDTRRAMNKSYQEVRCRSGSE